MDIKRISDENLHGKPCGLNHCFSSVPILFVHMRNKFFYMSVVDSVSPHY